MSTADIDQLGESFQTERRIDVLHVEDNQSFADLCGEFLERETERLSVHTAQRPATALEYLEDTTVDCIVSDYDMPGQNGIEFLETVRKDHPDLPFLLFTGKGSEEVASEAISKGVSDYLQKQSGTEQYELLANRIVNLVDKHRSQQRAQRIERWLRELAKETNNVLWIFSGDMDEVIFVNSAFEELFGLSTDRLYEDPQSFLEAIHPDDRSRAERAVDQLLDGQPANLEHRVNETEDYQRRVYVQGQPILDDDGEVVRIVGITTDITERKKREQQLRLFRRAVESSGHSIYFTDRNGTIEYVNEAFKQTTGYTAEEAIGLTPRILKSGEHDREFYEDLWGTILEGNVWRDEVINKTKGGERYVVDQTIAPVTDGTGKLTHFVAVNADITEQQSRQQELNILWKAIDNAHSPLVLTDPQQADNPIVYANEAFETLTGYTEEEILGRNCRWLQGEETDPETVSRLREAIDNEEAITVELRNYRKDGTQFWNELTVTPVYNEEGDLVRFLGTQRDITDRKRAERELQEISERLELAINGGNLGVWDWDMSTDEVQFNDNWATMLGYGPEEIGSQLEEWRQRVHPNDIESVEAALEKHIDGDTDYYVTEHRMRTADDDWKWIRDVGKIFERDEDGEPIRAVGIHLDIDERKRVQRTLREERDLFTQGPAVVFKWKNEEGWPVEYVSENVEDVFGYTPEELTSGDILFADLISDEDLDRVRREVEAHDDPATERFSHEPYRVVTADGDIRWVLDHSKIVRDGDEITHLLGYLVDITERKQREQELHEREAKYRSLFEDTRDALMLIDREGYLDCNEQALELFGIESVEDLLEYTPWELSPPTQPDGTGSKDKALEYIEKAFEEGEAFFEWTHQRADGTDFPAEVKLSQVNHQGTPMVYALVRDISDRKHYEQQLEEQRDNLKILNQMMRHDIRNDLQLVLAYAETLEDHVDEEGQKYIRQVIEPAREAVDITMTARAVTEVLLQSGADRVPIQLRSILENEINEIRSNTERASLTMESLPDVTVIADDMLGSVFRNLLKNAVVHNDKEVPKVTVSASTSEEVVRIRVADNGPGIPDNQKERIFEEGEKNLDSGGTGLGLYLVKTLVDRYEGDIWVEDNDPKGCVFVVELPLADK